MQWMDQYYTGFSEAFHKKPSSMTIEAYFAGFPFPAKKKPVVIDIDGYYVDITPFIEQDKIAYRANPPNLNIWEGIGIGRSELKHCAFLAWLLNPSANHCQGPLFFVSLLEEMDEVTFLEEARSGKYRVVKEDNYKELGRIDINLIGKGFMVLIEAKIDAYLKATQLLRYRTVIESKIRCSDLNKNRFRLFLLTKDSRKKDNDEVDALITWGTIAKVCKKFSNNCENGFIRELVDQYADFIRKSIN